MIKCEGPLTYSYQFTMANLYLYITMSICMYLALTAYMEMGYELKVI